MQINKILSAPLIDIIFDGRPKDYGAYELRKTYSNRINKALAITIALAGMICCSAILANSPKKNRIHYTVGPTIVLPDHPEKKIEPKPKPEKQPEVKPPKTIIFTEPVIKEVVEFPPPRQEEMDSAKFGSVIIDGPGDDGIPKPGDLDGDKGIVQPKNEPESDEPRAIVDIPARFVLDWKKFLIKNLKAETPVDNGAGVGRYTVVIQFVVDKEGNVSDIKALTNHGYGMEEEALRVIKKSPQWEPAIYNGYKVKAYHKQMITFDVQDE
ncbi:MAG TPA: energy transducer TonB [Chitinophagaceae bacterium]|nr:energy transducer TonB [Chitinophagaceae bacterium]